jgi:hypothetical protein
MGEVVVINSFHNHDSLFYPIKTLKSIPGLALKITVLPDFNRKFNLLSPIILLYFSHKFSNITEYLTVFIRYISKFFSSSTKASQKKCNSMKSTADSCRFYWCAFLKCDRCINTGESAAVFGFLLRIKVVELLLPETAAAGSLFLLLNCQLSMVNGQL